MKFIAHRGNIFGKNTMLENTHIYIEQAIEKGYDVEVDVWYSNGLFYLGHDSAGESTSASFLKDNHLWCHAKNIEALDRLLDAGAHCFFHMTDDVVLTSKGIIWTFPGKILTQKSVCVLPEIQPDLESFSCYGICSDVVEKYRICYEAKK